MRKKALWPQPATQVLTRSRNVIEGKYCSAVASEFLHASRIISAHKNNTVLFTHIEILAPVIALAEKMALSLPNFNHKV
jgi:hypothetical protein